MFVNKPADPLAEAARLHASGKLEQADELCVGILRDDPACAPAHLLRGVIAAKKGDGEAAKGHLTEVLKHDPRSGQAHLWLSMLFRKEGEKDLSLKHAQSASSINPRDPQIQNQLGLSLLDHYRHADAESCFRRALAFAPNVSVIHYGLGLAYQGLQKNPEAVAAFRRAGDLDPNSASTQTTLRQILMDELDPTGAVQCAKRVVALQPDSAEAKLWLARALVEDNKPSEAQPLVEAAMESDSKNALAYTLLGSVEQGLGDIEAADASFRKSIELAPDQGSAYAAWAANKKVRDVDLPLVKQMKTLAEKEDLPLQHRSQIHYAIGKASEDLANYEEAMRNFDAANQLAYQYKFGDRQFDKRSMVEAYDFLIQTFTKSSMARNSPASLDSKMPIFVVGMMRSGTTLAEQILSSHPDVGAAGEQRFWSDHRNSAFAEGGGELNPRALQQLAHQYLSVLKEIEPDKARVVDKMPSNFVMIGLIHLAFPRAKIIHATRHPVDTCISIYTTQNRARIEWAHHKENIAFAYEQYLRLMDHWKRVLPEGVMLDVPYETVVSNREAVTREMLAFCGLPWDDACLEPEKNERAVVTPSVWQVRQPVYSTSVERWRRYEPWLGPFARLM